MPSPLLTAGDSRLLRIEEILEYDLLVPQFQRPYDWDKDQVEDLINDLREAKARGTPLFLGLVVVHVTEAKSFAVIDGQQRLTTLMLAIAALGGINLVMQETSGIARPWIRPRIADIPFAKALIQKRPESPETLAHWHMTSAYAAFVAAPNIDISTILKCEIIIYVAPSLAGATRLFERINLRGKKVGQFDLVKNKLIEWASAVEDASAQKRLEEFITTRYDKLYKLLDPSAKDGKPYPSDTLLKVHWILFLDMPFKSGEQVLVKLDAWLSMHRSEGRNISSLIERYLDSLVQTATIWVYVERPYLNRRNELGSDLYRALIDFARLDRDGEFQPLIVAAVIKFGKSAAPFVRFCEIDSFRTALARKNSNYGREKKWRMARQLHNDTFLDATGTKINNVAALVHQVFWSNTPWWNKAEAFSLGDVLTNEEAAGTILPTDALENPRFLKEYSKYVHYIFWKYGTYLLADSVWGAQVAVDISPFQDSVWFDETKDGFRKWDIEHIYPQNPDDRETPDGKKSFSEMKDYLNHLGNLTVLPIKDNRGMQNRAFRQKLQWLRDQRKVPFNELLSNRAYTGNLLSGGHWLPNNCRKRLSRIKIFADAIWGPDALADLGVEPHDRRIQAQIDDDVTEA